MGQPTYDLLVVDDLPDNLDLLCEHLEDQPGYCVRTAGNGRQALKAVDEQWPDLILLDVMMPDIDGIEVCRRIKAVAGNRFIPIVLVTAYSDGENKRIGLEAGADDFVAKPFDRYELLARIRNLLHTKTLYDERNAALERIEREVKEIANLQRSLIPGLHPAIPCVHFHDFYMPSREAGGDYFDYVQIDPEHLGICVADVSGHGPSASVLMAMVKMILHLSRSLWDDPVTLLHETDRQLAKFIPPGEFVTVFYGVLEIPNRRLRYASAGHCAPILFGPGCEEARLVRTDDGYPLCLIEDEDNPLVEYTLELGPGSRLLLYTDGLIEVQDAERRIWGVSSMLKLLDENRETPGHDVIRTIVEAALEHGNRERFRDDCTLLLVDWK